MDIDFDSLAQQALQPPTSGPTPTGRVVPFPGTAAPTADYDALAGTVMDMQRSAAAQNLVAAQSSDPDRTAKALQIARTTGIPQPAVEANLDQAQQSANLTKNMQTLDASPALSSFVAGNPLAARMAQDDFDKLSFVERMSTALKSGAATALLSNQLGRIGNEKQAASALGIDTPALDARANRLQASIGAQPKLNGAMGVAQGVSGLIAGLVDNAIEGGSQGALVGAGIGAAGGSLFGGIGAAPGAAAGAATGGAVGFNVDMARVAAGNSYLKMSQIRGADGQPVSEAGKQFGAITTGVLTYLIGTYAGKIESKVLGETAESLAQQAVQKAVQTPTFARAATDFGVGTLKGAGQGAGIMTAMEASTILGEQLAKTVTQGDFASDPHEMVERLADAAVNGAVTLGAMHGAMKGLALYGDVRNSIRAQGQAEVLRNLMTGAEGSKLRERDLQAFQDFMQQQTQGSPVEHLYLPADAVRELYQGARLDPATLADRAKDPLFGFVADMPQQLSEAAASGGDVVIPTADFVTHLAGTPLAEKLLPDMRVGADAMSLNEAQQYRAEYEARLKSAVEEAGKTEPTSTQRIEDEVRQQAVAAGYPEAIAGRYAKLYAARYATRGERLGIDPYEAFKQSGVTIEKGSAAGEGGRVLNQAERPEASVGATLLEVGKHESFFQYPKSSAKTLEGIAADKQPSLKVTEETITQMDGSEKSTGNWDIVMPDGAGTVVMTRKGDKVWINAAGLKSGSRGSLAYDLVANYAHNNGLKFIGDPAGVSKAAMLRRAENMLSSAVKYGTTDHLEPHPDQLKGNETIPGLAWRAGDTEGNIRSLVGATMEANNKLVPNAADFHYDPADGRFKDSTGADIPGTEFLAHVSDVARGTSGAGAPGEATLRRNALFAALLQGEGTRRAFLDELHRLGSDGSEGAGGALGKSFYQGLEEGPRGSIRFTDGKAVISLFEKADSSTLIHESGHAWLEELASDAQRADAPAQIAEDMATVREWLGNAGSEFTTEQHEQFARAAEAYLMEGKAPSVMLARVFSRFKDWLTRIYKAVASLDTPINDDIRGVFDRLLATDAEIQEARSTTGLEPNFKTREDAGMTSAEWRAYTGAIDRANQDAESKLLDKAMARVRRERTAEYKAERAKAVEEASREIDARPDIDALNFLRGSKVPGNPENIKLSAADVERTYGKQGLAEMPARTTGKEGTHPDVLAEMLGFNSGDELVRALQGLESQQREAKKQGDTRGIRQYLIDQAADEKMQQRAPDAMDEASIRAEALAAVHSEKRAELLAQELRYLKRSAARELEAKGAGRKAVEQVRTEEDWKAAEADLMAKLDRAKDQNRIDELKGQLSEVREQMREGRADERVTRAALREAVNVSRPMLEAIGRQVDAMLERKTTAEIGRLDAYLRDERKAAREVEQAILKKDWNAAAAAKQRQLLSHILYTRAKAAADQIDSGTRNMQRLVAKKTFKTIAQEYTNQIHDLLQRFGFDSGRGEELQRGKQASLEEFVKDKAADAGVEIAVDPALYTMDDKPVGELTYAEFKALDDAVRSLQTLGRDEKTILVDGQRVDFAEVRKEMVDAIRALGERLKSDFYDPRDAGKLATAKEKLFGALRSIDASLVKPEALFDQIDRANPFGIMNRAVFRRMKEAQSRADLWHDAAAKEMTAAVKAGGKDWAKRLDDTVPEDAALPNPDTGRPMKLTRKRLLSIALNWGNEGNRTKLAEGYKWSPTAIKAFLDRNMTKADWDFVQRIWGMFDAHKDDLDQLQRRVTGVGLDLVQADRFSTPHGEYAGGYYPIVYDPGRSFNAEAHAEKASEALFPNGYTRATTPKGSTIARVEGVKRPIQLSLDIAPWKIGQVIHDLAFREAIIDADRLLSSDQVKKAFDDVFGPEYRKLLRPWLKHVANSRNIDDTAISWLDKAISTARTNTVIVGIGFRLSTMFKHGFGALSNSVKEVGPAEMLKATMDFYRPGRLAENWKFITDRSTEMQFRMNAYDKDIASAYEKLVSDSAYTKFQKEAQHFGHLGVSYLDLGSAAPTWLAAYRKGIKQGLEEKDAIYAADKTVRNAHGAQGITDTALIQRSGGVANLVNMFYGFFNHIYNRQRTIFIQGAEGVRNAKAGEYKAATKNFADALATSFWYIAVPALVETLAHHGGPNQDKDEGWGAWAAKAILGEIPAGIPVIRDIAKSAIEGRDYEISPIAKAVQDVVSLKRDISNYVQGNDPSPNAGKHVATAAGYLLGLPTAAPFTVGRFLWDVGTGDADPRSIHDWYEGLTKGKVTQE